MNVLFPIDLITFNPSNPYIVQLMQSLADCRQICNIGYGYVPFYWKKPLWDIVHIQWPEALVGWHTPGPKQIDAVRQTLEKLSRNSSIVLTVHNYGPQEDMGPAGDELFNVVFHNCDAFIHLGKASLEWFLKNNANEEWCSKAIHTIIEHGDYRYYNKLHSSKAAVPKSAKTHQLYLVFGTIRTVAEEALALEAFRLADLKSAKLVLAGMTSPEVRRNHKNEPALLDLPHVIRRQYRIAPEHVKPLFRASRFAFIPRCGRLNSGILPLAFTFGIPVIGPSDGVIGEIIQATDNIFYSPGDPQSASEALRRAHSLSDTEYDAMAWRTIEYCKDRMNWANLARQHVALYNRTRGAARRVRSIFGWR